MGIVSSTFASLAIRFAWNCQRLLDPRYRCIENKTSKTSYEPVVTDNSQVTSVAQTAETNKRKDETYLQRRENRRRRAARMKERRRSSSFDMAQNRSKNSFVAARRVPALPQVTSIPNTYQQCLWDVCTSSGCSSDSASDIESESDYEFDRICSSTSANTMSADSTEESELMMSPAEEEAFRLTVGRGYFTCSKKDRFLNHLRLEKRLNEMNKFYTMT